MLFMKYFLACLLFMLSCVLVWLVISCSGILEIFDRCELEMVGLH